MSKSFFNIDLELSRGGVRNRRIYQKKQNISQKLKNKFLICKIYIEEQIKIDARKC